MTKKEEKESITISAEEIGTVEEVLGEKKIEPRQQAANSLTKQRIEKLFRMFCFNYLSPGDNVDWESCSGCLLREIPWTQATEKSYNTIKRDLCFAIWHEGVLNA